MATSQQVNQTNSKIKFDEIKQNYTDGETVDKSLFAEQRSNILLIAGEHYTKKNASFIENIRRNPKLSQDQKIRLTNNHIYKIMRSYSNNIVSYSGDITSAPLDERSMQDVKSAELHAKVIKYMKNKHRMAEKVRKWADDFTGIGEFWVDIFFDPSLGKRVGYEPKVDEFGAEVLDEFGQMVADESKPVHAGDFVLETYEGFNVIRDQSAKTIEESPMIHLRKMVKTKKMKEKWGSDPEKAKLFTNTAEGNFVVFDSGNSTGYTVSKDECLLVKTYIRPCFEYPEGYWVLWTENGVVEEGPLPFGRWCLANAYFDTFQTSPRGKSHIKVIKPFQVEVNRTVSKMAEHQITLGDDKIIHQAGTKLTEGNVLPGIRGIQVTGMTPTILSGRSGEQYINHLDRQISGMYSASLVGEEEKEMPAQIDAYSLLFKSGMQKKKFKVYTERFSQGLKDVWEILLDLARHYLPDDELSEAIGRDEVQNIPEFRNPSKICYQIILEEQGEDVETKLGRQLMITQTLQYVGGQLKGEEIGKLLKNAPYANFAGTLEDFTLEYESGTNMLLSLDRGEQYQPNYYDDAQYMIKRLENRRRKPDYKMLPPQIQQAYDQVLMIYQQLAQKKLAQEMAAKSGFIPTGGGMIACDLYVPDPKNPQSSKRARVPQESLQWLFKSLEAQGTTQESLNQMSDSQAATIVEGAMKLAPQMAAQMQHQQMMQQNAMQGSMAQQPPSWNYGN